MSSFSPFSEQLFTNPLESPPEPTSTRSSGIQGLNINLKFFAAAAFLVSVPVFIQAPLVRVFPWISLALTGGWLWLSLHLRSQPKIALWGDLLLGFTWTWLAGSLYWGWMRGEPLLHLPIEAIGLPFAWLALRRGEGKIGNWFYLGSLFGTATTDIYFYLVNLIPHWRQIVRAEPDLLQPIFQSAIAQVQTPWGIGCAIALSGLLLLVGGAPLRQRQLHYWAFSGAVLSTMLVDGLFWLAAMATSGKLG